MPSEWLQKQQEIASSAVEYLRKRKLRAVVLKDENGQSQRPYVRVFFAKNVFCDLCVKHVKSRYVTDVWLVPERYLRTDRHYLVHVGGLGYFYVLSGDKVSRIAEKRRSTYNPSLTFLVVPLKSFIPLSVWVGKKKAEVEEKLQRRMTDFFTKTAEPA